MIPVGYMAKRIVLQPDWLKADQIVDIYSVSNCVSKDFANYIDYWKHNGYWFFDSPEIIQQVANEHSIDLNGTKLFYYEVYESEYDEQEHTWSELPVELPFETHIIVPDQKTLEGYDLVSFELGNSAECSPLSCNGLAKEVTTNQHCLLDSFEQAKELLESEQFTRVEPGPYRILAVCSVER